MGFIIKTLSKITNTTIIVLLIFFIPLLFFVIIKKIVPSEIIQQIIINFIIILSVVVWSIKSKLLVKTVEFKNLTKTEKQRGIVTNP